MTRCVKHTAQGPSRLVIGGQNISICRCGLTKNPDGLCDGSHIKTLDEKEEICYCYDELGKRRECMCDQ